MRQLPLLSLLLCLAPFGFAAADPGQFAAARELYAARKDAEARAAFIRLVATAPTHAPALYHLGLLALRAADTDGAIKYLEKAVALEPDQVDYLLNLADAYGGKVGSAGVFTQVRLAGKIRELLERAVRLAPANPETRAALVLFYSQAPALVGGGTDKAHAQADALSALDPLRGRLAKAGIYGREKKYDEAFALFEAVLRENPGAYPALYSVGRLAAVSGERLDRGLECLQRCLTLPSPANQPTHAVAHWRIGNILEKKGDKAGARAAYEAALDLEPKFKEAGASLKKL